MKTSASALGCLVLAGALLRTAPASADASPSDVAAAEVVFVEAKKLVAQGRFNEACPKFEESQRLDPTPGTLLNIGDCFLSLAPPRTASAWGAYQQAGSMARNRGDLERQEAALQRARAIEPTLSKVSISPSPDARVPGLDVKWDGKIIGPALWETAIPVDPGAHTIEAGAPGKGIWAAKVVVLPNGGTMKVEVPGLPEPPPGPGGVRAESASTWSGRRTAGLVVGAAGLVGIVVGAVFGAKAMSKDAESHPHCLPTDFLHCDPQGIVLGHEAIVAGNTSTVGFVVGGVAVLGGAILFLTAPSSPSSGAGARLRYSARPIVGSSGGGLLLSGEW
ncbi:MAG: hypothetical protein ABJE95_20745 [Byssovorax sp.]